MNVIFPSIECFRKKSSSTKRITSGGQCSPYIDYSTAYGRPEHPLLALKAWGLLPFIEGSEH